MSWAEMRIQQYKKGQTPRFLEKISLEHANPVNFTLHIISLVFFSYGIWEHNLIWILMGGFSSIIGHIYCRLRD